MAAQEQEDSGPLSAFGNDSYAEQDVDGDEDGTDELIPSRDFLKQSCVRQLNDVSRKREQAEKRKKMMEVLFTTLSFQICCMLNVQVVP